MDPLPFVPNRLRKDKHDVASTIRKSFQEILYIPAIPTNLLDNCKSKFGEDDLNQPDNCIKSLENVI